jgi:hypothetical protein
LGKAGCADPVGVSDIDELIPLEVSDIEEPPPDPNGSEQDYRRPEEKISVWGGSRAGFSDCGTGVQRALVRSWLSGL